MLVLSRKAGESLLIDDRIRVTVVKVGGRVHIGIEAPSGVRIIRSEIADRAPVEEPPSPRPVREQKNASRAETVERV